MELASRADACVRGDEENGFFTGHRIRDTSISSADANRSHREFTRTDDRAKRIFVPVRRSNRTTSVSGTLTLGTASRSRNAQAGAGGSDRLPTDDGGHYIAARFNGPTYTFNHFARDANFNRGSYRVLENGWAKDIEEGKQVYVAINPTYDDSSKRPSNIIVFSQ